MPGTTDSPLIDAGLVARLISGQFPGWAELPIRAVEPGGVDNRTFRLGDHMLVRLPSASWYADQVDKEHRWLPALGAALPLPIPVPLARGAPAEGYPFPWSVYRWLDGETAAAAHIVDQVRFAADLAAFLRVLQQIDASGGPPPGAHNFHRGGALAIYDEEARRSIRTLAGEVPSSAAEATWDAALSATWSGAPVWVHGDVAAGNLLVEGGRLSAVIDFGCCAVGDPAGDLTIAWTFLSGEAREAFQRAVPAAPATWSRARGWALWKALLLLIEHRDRDAAKAAAARAVIDAVLAE